MKKFLKAMCWIVFFPIAVMVYVIYLIGTGK